MKINWRALIAIVILVGATIWGISSLRTYSYSGTDFNFVVGSGPITVTNPSAIPVPAHLVSARVFRVSSSAANLTGRSISQGIGRTATQLFEFTLPFGVNEFTVIGGTNVSFVASTDTPLEAAVYLLNAEDARATFIIIVAVVLGALFLLSSANDHRWISASRRQKALDKATAHDVEQKMFNRTFGRIHSDK